MDFHLTPAAENFYSQRAAAHGQTLDEYLNETLPAQLPDGGYVNDQGEYRPTAEEWQLIQEGLDDLAAGRTVTLEEAFAGLETKYFGKPL